MIMIFLKYRIFMYWYWLTVPSTTFFQLEHWIQTSYLLFLNLLDEFKKKMKNSEEKKWLWGRTQKNWYCTESCDPVFADSFQFFRIEWEHFWAPRNYKIFLLFRNFWRLFHTEGELRVWLHWWAVDKEFPSLVQMCTIFWSFFCCNFGRQICTKGWLRRRLWVGGGGGGGFPREFGLIPPIKSFSRPPRSFLNLLVSVSEVYRGDENFLHRWKQKLRTTPILRESGPARTENNDFQQKHIRVVLR